MLKSCKKRRACGGTIMGFTKGSSSTTGAITVDEKMQEAVPRRGAAANIPKALSVPEVPDLGTGIAEQLSTACALVASLSQREHEILKMVMAGKQNRAIGDALGISVRTVEVHRTRLMSRLGVRTLAAAVKLAAWAELADATRDLNLTSYFISASRPQGASGTGADFGVTAARSDEMMSLCAAGKETRPRLRDGEAR
jgi:DNA-binding CsgD family transcriptional regulator